MAVYVKMIKKFDDEKRVVYQFGPNEKQMGEIEFDKEKKIFNSCLPRSCSPSVPHSVYFFQNDPPVR